MKTGAYILAFPPPLPLPPVIVSSAQAISPAAGPGVERERDVRNFFVSLVILILHRHLVRPVLATPALFTIEDN